LAVLCIFSVEFFFFLHNPILYTSFYIKVYFFSIFGRILLSTNSEEVMMDAIELVRAGTLLNQIERSVQTYQVCLAAVNRNGLNLQYISAKRRSYALCLAACYQTGEALSFVPKDLLDRRICGAAVSRNAAVLSMVPSQWLDEMLVLSAVKNSGKVLALIPERFKTFVLCKVAIEQDCTAVNFVPSEFIGTKLFERVPLKAIPDEFRSYGICLSQVNIQGRQLKFVPMFLRDEAMCIAAMKNNSWALEFVPSEYYSLPEIQTIINDESEELSDFRKVVN
jgi:hypothetical protein